MGIFSPAYLFQILNLLGIKSNQSSDSWKLTFLSEEDFLSKNIDSTVIKLFHENPLTVRIV